MSTSIRKALAMADGLDGVSDSPRLDAELLVGHALGRDRRFVYAWPEHDLTPAQHQRYRELLQRRLRGEPLAYILERRAFWTLELAVNGAVLIPRPETELLVEQALAYAGQAPRRVLELGTGSGAVALALASERPSWDVVATDCSGEALAVARANAWRLGTVNLAFVQTDWYRGLSPEKAWHLIVGNPPYVDGRDPHLGQGDLRFEPRGALVAGEQGLADIRTICRGASQLLLAGGALLLEHGWQQGPEVRRLMHDSGLGRVRSFRDLAGHERVSVGVKD